jgi:16S rRNA (cytosine1402-N4)-methyltransferase
MNEGIREHEPVLVRELIDAVVVGPGGVFVDCTFGRGGHALAVLERAGPDARLLGLDRDPDAVRAGARLAQAHAGLEVLHARFGDLGRVLEERGMTPDAIYFDLGVSSPQLDQPHRGFSFLRDGPLDMRMDPGAGESAARWLAHAAQRDIEAVLRDLGEERYARRIARAIVRARAEQPLRRTAELAALVAAAMPAAARHAEAGQHPATRTFQALRMHVNDEVAELDAGLEQAVDALRADGRLAVISFHSGEDRRVKRFLRDASRPPRPSRHLPLPPDLPPPRLYAVAGPVSASAGEIARNPRARSARLRHARRCA